jgi:hypothetical protein
MTQQLRATLRQRWLTTGEALNLCQCYSLSQRCSEYRRAGVNVLDKWVHLPSGKRIKAYRIV